jgi:hypothetical protein
MPIMPTDSQSPLADLLGSVNRPQLNAFVATAQAKNGLVSAQTQDAMIRAQQGQEEMAAHEQLLNTLTDAGMKGSDAALTKSLLLGHFGNAETTLKAVAAVKLGYGTPEEQTAGQQMSEGKVAPLQAVPNNFVVPAGQAQPNIQQSPQGAAQTAEMNALAGLNTHKNENPADFRTPPLGATSPEGQVAIAKAVQEGRLDPTRLNSRTAPIYAQMEMATPGMNFNRLHADAALQANSLFQQKAMSVDMLPGLLSNVTSLGKKLNGGTGYNDLKSVGIMQQVLNGQTNDPDYTEYMTARNDTLLRLAGVMRGVGMSDQAHTAEVQAMAPTLSPAALDAWFKGQMSVVKPLLDRQNRITHLGETGQGTQPLQPSGPAGAPAAAPAPLGDTIPSTPGPAPGGLPSYPNEQAALAAGHHKGDRVMIGGVTGTLQ